MYKPVFDVVLLPQEWLVLKTLYEIEIPTQSRVVKETLNVAELSCSCIHQILNRLSVGMLTTRETILKSGPSGSERKVLWQLSVEGRKFFPESPNTINP